MDLKEKKELVELVSRKFKELYNKDISDLHECFIGAEKRMNMRVDELYNKVDELMVMNNKLTKYIIDKITES